MLEICKAKEKDKNEIIEIIKELDLSYPDIEYNHFWVAKEKGEVIGVSNLEEFDDFFFLSSVGVKTEYQKKGIAAALLRKILKTVRKDVYLYTTIPCFFERFGFKTLTPKQDLPAKKTFLCRDCTPQTCTTMVKLYDAA